MSYVNTHLPPARYTTHYTKPRPKALQLCWRELLTLIPLLWHPSWNAKPQRGVSSCPFLAQACGSPRLVHGHRAQDIPVSSQRSPNQNVHQQYQKSTVWGADSNAEETRMQH